jgi:hypothetical protein
VATYGEHPVAAVKRAGREVFAGYLRLKTK